MVPLTIKRLYPSLCCTCVALVLSLFAVSAAAEPAPDPTLCLGWNPETLSFAPVGSSGITHANSCAAGHALVSVHYAGGERVAGRYISIAGTCCPLPPDALEPVHEFVETTCSEGFVATGAEKDQSEPIHRLRCTKVNQARYRLGEDSRGLNVGWINHFRVYFDRSTSFSRLPYGLRLGLGRLAKYGWDKWLCVGFPWGSILTGKESKYCDGHHFRPLLVQVDGQAHPAVDYESCSVVDDRYSHHAQCIVRRN